MAVILINIYRIIFLFCFQKKRICAFGLFYVLTIVKVKNQSCNLRVEYRCQRVLKAGIHRDADRFAGADFFFDSRKNDGLSENVKDKLE